MTKRGNESAHRITNTGRSVGARHPRQYDGHERRCIGGGSVHCSISVAGCLAPTPGSKIIPLLILLLWLSVGLVGNAQGQAPLPVPTRLPADPVTPPAPGVPASAQQIALSPVATNPGVAALVAQVDGARWHADVTTLAHFGAAIFGGWGTRRSLTVGNLDARDWLSARLSELGWTTALHAFTMWGGTSYNVIGERVGSLYPDEIYIVGAHMDSTSPQEWTLAPGAEDNASGTAGLLEVARVLADQTPARTIRLVAFSGEEQGLIGSSAYAAHLSNVTHELDNVKGVYIMDMIGYTSDPDDLKVLLESRDPDTYPWMGDLRAHLISMAGTYTSLQVYTSNQPLGSDHQPFLRRQVPAVLLIAAEFDSYPYYHTTQDLPAYVVPAQGQAILQMLVASLAEKAGVVCIFADVTCDGAVNVTDLVELANHWRLDPRQAGNERYDLNRDNQINIVDLQLAVLAFTG